jgi:hypothetical protein
MASTAMIQINTLVLIFIPSFLYYVRLWIYKSSGQDGFCGVLIQLGKGIDAVLYDKII